jgi:hypothetical protein
VERCGKAMRDLFGLDISTGTIDSIYGDAARRLRRFIAALTAFLRTLAVLHADETTDRVGTTNCWMHVVSTSLYTLIHGLKQVGRFTGTSYGELPNGILVRLSAFFASSPACDTSDVRQGYWIF